jgi:hypothetical protein
MFSCVPVFVSALAFLLNVGLVWMSYCHSQMFKICKMFEWFIIPGPNSKLDTKLPHTMGAWGLKQNRHDDMTRNRANSAMFPLHGIVSHVLTGGEYVDTDLLEAGGSIGRYQSRILPPSSALTMEAVCSSETLIPRKPTYSYFTCWSTALQQS